MAMSTTFEDLIDKLSTDVSNNEDQSDNFPFLINNVRIPPPSDFKVETYDLYLKAWRDDAGIEHGQRIRTNVRKLFFTWEYLTKEDAAGLLALVANQYFTVTYPDDPVTGQTHTITAYAGDRSMPLWSYKKGYTVWESVTFNCIEQ